MKDAWESCEQRQTGVLAHRMQEGAGGTHTKRRPSITLQVRRLPYSFYFILFSDFK
jgi:hypothetical protein